MSADHETQRASSIVTPVLHKPAQVCLSPFEQRFSMKGATVHVHKIAAVLSRDADDERVLKGRYGFSE